MQIRIAKGETMSTYRDVKAQINKLEKQAADLLKKEVAEFISKTRTQILEYGLTAADLGLTGKATKPSTKLKSLKTGVKRVGVPKYRDPASGKTWTGKGKAPGWINEGLARGQSKDDFLIGKKSPAKAAAAKKVAKLAKPAKTAKVTKATKAVKTLKATKKPLVKKVSAAAKPIKQIRKPRAKKPEAAAVPAKAEATPA
jgi:DNA-binding protein H-NS